MRRVAAALLVALVAGSIGASAILLQPGRTRGDAFLFGDEGHNLWVASALDNGVELYSGAYTLYGPAAVWTYRAATSIAANTPATYQALNVVLSLCSLILLQRALARHGSLTWSVAWTLAALVPSMLAPGSLLGGLTVSSYVALERVVLSLVIWAWRPAHGRSAARSLLLGCACGGLVWVKFGATALAVLGVLAADLLRPPRAWRAAAWFCAGTAATVAAFVIWAFLAYPAPLARDLVWPSYLLASYGWVTPEERWPSVFPLTIVLAQYAPALAGITLCVAGAVVTRLSASVEHAVLPAVAFMAGVALTFQHAHHVTQYAWLLAAAGGIAAVALPGRWRAAALLAVLPACLVLGRAAVAPAAPVVEVHTPRAGTVFLREETFRRTAALARYADESRARGEAFLVGPHAGGWHAAYGVRIEGRHAWFLEGFVRPWEESAVVAQFERLSAVIVCPGGTGSWDRLHLPTAVLARVRPMFAEESALADCAVWKRP